MGDLAVFFSQVPVAGREAFIAKLAKRFDDIHGPPRHDHGVRQPLGVGFQIFIQLMLEFGYQRLGLYAHECEEALHVFL